MYWKDDLNKGTAYVINASLYGEKVLQLKTDNLNNIAQVYQTIKIEPGEYVLSGYIQNQNGGKGLLDLTGSNVTIINRSSDDANENYHYYYLKFKVSSASTINIYLKNEAVGKSYFDMIQLNSTIIDNRYNYLQNSSFEHGNVGWSGLTSSKVILNDENKFAANVFGKYSANIDQFAIEQTVAIKGEEGGSFVFGGFTYNSNINYRGKITLIFNYDNYTYGVNTIKFDANDLNLQYMLYKAVAQDTFSSITIRIERETVGSLNIIKDPLKVDNIVLYKEGYGLELSYKDDGNLEKSFNEVTKDSTEISYDSNSEISTIKQNNVVTGILRNGSYNLVNEITTNNVSTNYQRDSKGNVTGYTVTSETENGKVIHFTSSTIYSPDKQYIISETNDNNWVTSYTIDYLTGLVSSISDNNSQSSYEFDLLQNKTKTSIKDKNTGKVRTVTYEYEGKK